MNLNESYAVLENCYDPARLASLVKTELNLSTAASTSGELILLKPTLRSGTTCRQGILL